VTPDAIVVGGGIVGLSAARELAGLGARVVVVERRRVGEEASSAAAGMLAPQVHADADTPLLELSLRARDRHLALAGELEAETGISVEISSLGALDVAFTDEDERALGARLAWQRGHGLPVEALTRRRSGRRSPTSIPRCAGARSSPAIAGSTTCAWCGPWPLPRSRAARPSCADGR
jgi:glycine oxidase